MKERYGGVIDGLGTLWARPPIRPKAIAELPTGEDIGKENYIGSGPYKMVTWDVGDKVVLERHEAYVPRTDAPSGRAGAQIPYLDRIIYLEIPSEETKIAGLKTGEFDMVDAPSLDFYDELDANPDIGVVLYLAGRQPYIGFNHAEAPTDSLKLRQAIRMSIENLSVMTAYGNPDLWILCAAIFGCGTALESDAASDFYDGYNVEGAKALLAESGYDGEPIKYLTPTDYATIAYGPIVKDAMEKIGINVDMPALDWATEVSLFRKKTDWNMFSSWGSHYGRVDPVLHSRISGAETSPGGYSSDKMNALRLGWAQAVDPVDKQRFVDDIQTLYYEDAVDLNFGEFFSIHPYRTWVKGFTFNLGYPSYSNVWLEGQK